MYLHKIAKGDVYRGVTGSVKGNTALILDVRWNRAWVVWLDGNPHNLRTGSVYFPRHQYDYVTNVIRRRNKK